MYSAQGRYPGRPRRDPQEGNRPQRASHLRAATPQIDPSQLASALKLRNFKKLVEVAGDENLALALDLTVQRVSELGRGERFTPETAHHIETTLALPGFLDHVNPQLTQEVINRLKSPLEFQVQEPAEPVAENAVIEPVLMTPELVEPVRVAPELAEPVLIQPELVEPVLVQPEPVEPILVPQELVEHVPIQQELVEPLAAEPVVAEPSESSTVVGQQIALPHFEETEMAKTSAAKQTTTEQPAPAKRGRKPQPASELQLRKIRMANLALVTSRPLGKRAFGKLMGMTAANVSHRLHGNKIFKLEDGQAFAKKLHLPEDWFEHPHEESDVPESVFNRLAKADEQPAVAPTSAAPKVPRAAKARKAPKEDTGSVKRILRKPRVTASPIPADLSVPRLSEGFVTRHPSPGQADASSDATPDLVAQAAAASAASAIPAMQPQAAAPAAPARTAPAAPAPVAAAPVAADPVAEAPARTAVAVAQRLAPAWQLVSDELGEIKPIAMALLQTLAIKAREGKLDELQAFELLGTAAKL